MCSIKINLIVKLSQAMLRKNASSILNKEYKLYSSYDWNFLIKLLNVYTYASTTFERRNFTWFSIKYPFTISIFFYNENLYIFIMKKNNNNKSTSYLWMSKVFKTKNNIKKELINITCEKLTLYVSYNHTQFKGKLQTKVLTKY